MPFVPLLERYRDFLPVTERTPRLTLHEGFTPLIRARNLEREIGVRELWLKFEGTNPTGSFKDRGMVLAVAKALEEGARAVACASTGNTSAAAAAYAARAGIRAYVLIPAGKIALGKLAQALAYGARVLAVRGNFDQALALVRQVVERHPITLVNSLNPYRLEGQTTAAYEVCEALGRAPDVLCIPVGNAGNISAYWEGFRRYHAVHRTGLPRMWGFQAAGAAPLVLGRPVDRPETVATAIRIGRPVNAEKALRARDESGGRIEAVTDEEILAAQKALASLEGIFCEPASAASVAGLWALRRRGEADRDGTYVAVLTGHGLKDPQTPQRWAGAPIEVEATLEAVEAALGLD